MTRYRFERDVPPLDPEAAFPHDGDASTDDIARALTVAIRAGRAGRHLRPVAFELARRSLAAIDRAQSPDGRFGDDETTGRAIWSLGFATRCGPTFEFRAIAREVLDRALPSLAGFDQLTPLAYAALGISDALLAAEDAAIPDAARIAALREALAAIGDALLESYDSPASAERSWLDEVVASEGARLAEALLRIGDELAAPRMLAAGAASLSSYERASVGYASFEAGGMRGALDAAALVDAALAGAAAARRHTVAGLDSVFAYESLARAGLGWFDGTSASGGSATAEPGPAAASVLAFLLASYAAAEHLRGC